MMENVEDLLPMLWGSDTRDAALQAVAERCGFQGCFDPLYAAARYLSRVCPEWEGKLTRNGGA